MSYMLYYGPHPVHRRWATSVGAHPIAAQRGGPHRRLLASVFQSFERPVILEGGMPLLQGAMLKRLGKVDAPLIHLAADETIRNIVRPLPYYSAAERRVHRRSIQAIDAMISVSEYDARYGRQVLGVPTMVVHPFVTESRGNQLDELDPSLEGDRILCVGKRRPGHNQDVLVEGALEAGATPVLAGRGTKSYSEHDGVEAHGFVTSERLVELFGSADAFCLPALAGAFPVAVFEAMRAGLPVIVSHRLGNSRYVADIDPRLVTGTDADAVADTLAWFLDTSKEQRQQWADAGRQLASRFTEERQTQMFQSAYNQIVKEASA